MVIILIVDDTTKPDAYNNNNEIPRSPKPARRQTTAKPKRVTRRFEARLV